MIDADTGNIHLPNGFVITPALTLKEFHQSWFGRDAHFHCPTPYVFPWCRMNAGRIGVYSLEVSLSFNAEKVARVSLAVDVSHVPQNNRQDLLDTEAFHNALLRNDFGEPNASTSASGKDMSGSGKALNYLRPWGKASSGFKYSRGESCIEIRYKEQKQMGAELERTGLAGKQ